MNNGPERWEKELKDGGRERAAGEQGGVSAISEPGMEAILRETMRISPALPAGFKERVLARAAAEERPLKAEKVVAWPRSVVWRLAAAGALAASVFAGTFGVELERRHQETLRLAQERVLANQQFEQASRITEAALAHTRQQLQRAGVFDDAGR